MPKVDPDSGQMLSDDPDQADEDLAGGKTPGDYPKDHADTGHHSPITTEAGAQDEGSVPPGEASQGNLQDNPGGGSH